MILEKVYDELMAQIEDLKKQIQAGSGSDVSIIPTLQSGVKLADYSIDGTDGAIYAPSEKYNVFSTDETEIGTFLGAPLYRKVFSNVTVSDTLTTLVEGVEYAFLEFSIANGFSPFYFSSSNLAGTRQPYIKVEDNNAKIQTQSATSFTATFSVIYTKHTEAKKTTKKSTK